VASRLGGYLRHEFEQIMRQRRVRTVFQPIVSLESDAIIGFEALVRGPIRSPFASADALVSAAYEVGRIAEFDWVARASACRSALADNLPADALLFINIEPLALDSDCPPDLWPDIERAFTEFQVVLEVTERSLDSDPGSLLDGLDRHRPIVAGFALDDVGSNLTTLSMLPLVAPAVIKLDLQITQGNPSLRTVRVLDVVQEEAERTGAIMLCEGIETGAHIAAARSLGASLGQGYLLGRPGSLAAHLVHRETRPVRLRADTAPAVATPFQALGGRVIGRCQIDLFTTFAEHLESYGTDAAGAALFIEHFPDARHFGGAERRRLVQLAATGVMTAVLGPGVSAEPEEGLRGVGLRQEPDFAGEWAVVALSPTSAVALLARAIDDEQTEFEYGLTHNRQHVIAAARCLLRRLGAPTPRPRDTRLGRLT
jgi:EAL domain-containing protein (putative c-di-GMP-specific phosphodiesterase class I)